MSIAAPSPPDAAPPPEGRRPPRHGGPDSLADLGRSLRSRRRRLGLPLTTVADETRISVGYLEALERGAPIEEYPAPVFQRFFLREYAGYLGLDPAPLLEALTPKPPEEPAPTPPRREREPRIRDHTSTRPARRLLTVVAAVALTGLAVISFRSEGAPAAPPSPRAASSPAPRVVSPPATEPSPPPAAARDIRVVIEVTDRCWIEATADGDVVLARTLEAGERVPLRADETLTLVLGNAGAAKLQVNGKSAPTGGPGEVVRFTLRLKDGRIQRV